jgi:hypothetical protein
MGDIVQLGKVLRKRMAGGEDMPSRIDQMRSAMAAPARSATRANMAVARRIGRRQKILLTIIWFANGVGIAAMLAALWFYATGIPW